MIFTQQNLQNSINALAIAQTQAEQYAQILATPIPKNPNATQLANLEQAVSFFQAMKTDGTFTTSNGTVIDFSDFGGEGIFGAKTATFEADLAKVLNDSGTTLTIPTPNGDLATIMDTTTGEPASLLDLISNPNHLFTFSFRANDSDDNSSAGQPVSWCSGLFYLNYGTQLFTGGDVTTDDSGNTIPGGGLNFILDGTDTVDVTGTGKALLGYITPGSGSGNLGYDSAVFSQFINQYM
jgi:hypothetical protein